MRSLDRGVSATLTTVSTLPTLPTLTTLPNLQRSLNREKNPSRMNPPKPHSFKNEIPETPSSIAAIGGNSAAGLSLHAQGGPCKGPSFFFTLVTGPSRSLSLKLSDTRVYESHIVRPTAVEPTWNQQARFWPWLEPFSARKSSKWFKLSLVCSAADPLDPPQSGGPTVLTLMPLVVGCTPVKFGAKKAPLEPYWRYQIILRQGCAAVPRRARI